MLDGITAHMPVAVCDAITVIADPPHPELGGGLSKIGSTSSTCYLKSDPGGHLCGSQLKGDMYLSTQGTIYSMASPVFSGFPRGVGNSPSTVGCDPLANRRAAPGTSQPATDNTQADAEQASLKYAHDELQDGYKGRDWRDYDDLAPSTTYYTAGLAIIATGTFYIVGAQHDSKYRSGTFFNLGDVYNVHPTSVPKPPLGTMVLKPYAFSELTFAKEGAAY